VLFFLGGLIGARFGMKGFVQIPEGGTVDTIQLQGGGAFKLPFTIRCDDFELQNYPDGRPKDYISRLTVAKEGRLLQQKTIEVNNPLIQDGIFFYQSSYGKTGGGAVLRVLARDGRLLADELQLPEKGSVQVPGTNAVVEFLASTENLKGNGPAVQLTMMDTSGAHSHAGQPFVLLQRFPALDAQRGAELVFQLAGFSPGTPYTGLQVARDPGVPLIWAGALLLTVGTLLAFFLSHQRVWVRAEAGRVILAGTATRNQEAFRETLAALEEELRQATSAAVNRRAAV
jgi:cytochrome c biogenesis protein